MILRESIGRSIEGGWLGAVLLMLGIEAALGALFFVEMAAFSWLGSPDAPSEAVLNANVVELCVSTNGARSVSISRLEYGARKEAFEHIALLHPMQTPGRAAIISFEHRQPLRVVHSPVDDLMAIGCDDGSLYLFTPGVKDPAPRLLGRSPGGCIDDIAFSSDGRLLVSLDDSSLNVWRVKSTSLIRSLPTAPETFRCLVFIPSSQRILLGNTSGAIYEWNIAKPIRPKIFLSCVNFVHHLACSPDGGRAVVVGIDGALHVWDLASKQLLWRQPPIRSVLTSPAIFSADSETIINGFAHTRGDNRRSVELVIRSTETGEIIGKLVGHTQQISRLTISGENLLHSASRDGTVRTWDLRSRREIQRFSVVDCRPLEATL